MLGILAGRWAINIPGVMGEDWRTAGAKAAAFVVTYSVVLVFVERRELGGLLDFVKKHLFSRPSETSGL
jgi:hypothetical protein